MEINPEIVQWLTSLRRNTFNREPRPHKPVLLLAVLEMAENGQLLANEVPFGPMLFEYFGDYWKAVTDEPAGRIQYPFWHMRSEPFWQLVPHSGFEAKLTIKGSTPSAKQVSEWVRFARLDDRLFETLRDATMRDRLRGVLVAAYFSDRKERVADGGSSRASTATRR